MKEAYCSYEISKLLKRKGFEQHSCAHSYNSKGVFKWSDDLDPYEYSAPTHQMAMAWLRERNIGIVPEIHTTQDPKDYYWGACIFYLDKSWDILQYVSEPSKNVIDGYDGVIEQALKYVLENLI